MSDIPGEITHKTRLEDLTEDYTLEPVPSHINTSGLKVAMVICAIGITLPAIWVSSDTAINSGFVNANLGFWLGCGFVALMSLFTGIIGSRSRLSTYMIIQFSFGKTGAKLANVFMGITLLGWYAVTCEVFGAALADGIKELIGWEVNIQLAVLLSSILMTTTTIFGYKAVEKFSVFSVPLLAIFLIYVAYLAFTKMDASTAWQGGDKPDALMTLISINVGLSVLTAVLMPDFTRYCPNDKQSHIASLVGIGITYPLVMSVASIPAIVTGEADITMIMIGMGVVFSALFVLVFATWSTNITNLYSSTLTLSTFMPNLPNWKITLIGSAIATAGALTGLMDQYFTDFLIFIGIAASPLAAIYVVDFFLLKKGSYSLELLERLPAIGVPAVIAWVVASVFGYVSESQIFSLTPLSAFDALLVAGIVYFTLAKLMPPKLADQ